MRRLKEKIHINFKECGFLNRLCDLNKERRIKTEQQSKKNYCHISSEKFYSLYYKLILPISFPWHAAKTSISSPFRHIPCQ